MRARKISFLLTILWLATCCLGPWFPADSLPHTLLTLFPPIGLIAPTTPILIFPAIRLIRYASLKKSWQLDMAVVSLCTAMALLLLGPEIPSAPPPHHGPSFRIMTLNALGKNQAMPRLTALVRREQVDVVLMQEVNPAKLNQASFLAGSMPGWHIVRDREGAIVSRWPLTNVHIIPLKTLKRSAIVATVQAPRPFRVMTMHWTVTEWSGGLDKLRWTTECQRMDFDQTLQILKQERGPLIFGGDLNCTPQNFHIRTLSDRMESAFESRGWGFGMSFPWYFPMVRIDHLYNTGELVPLSAIVVDGCGSDHCGLMAEYSWTGN